MRPIALVFLAAVVLSLLPACRLVEFEHPLPASERDAPAVKLEGLWQVSEPEGEDTDRTPLTVMLARAGEAHEYEMLMMLQEPDGEAGSEAMRLEVAGGTARLTDVDGVLFLSCRFEATMNEGEIDAEDRYWLLIRVVPEGAHQWLLEFADVDAFAAAVKAEQIAGEPIDSGVSITAAPDELVDFLKQAEAGLFGGDDPIRLRRMVVAPAPK